MAGLLDAPTRIGATLERLRPEEFESAAHLAAIQWLSTLQGADPVARLHEATPAVAEIISRALSTSRRKDEDGKVWNDCMKQIHLSALNRRVDELNETLRSSTGEERADRIKELTQVLAEMNEFKHN